MIKKIVIAAAAACFVLAGISLGMASDHGPAEITLQTESAKKPALFPHKAHQDAFECAECHHSMGDDGAQVPYVEGQEIGKCASCHNSEKLAGKTKDKLKLDTLKGAGHGNCLECHKEVAKKDAAKKDLKKCDTCHPKK